MNIISMRYGGVEMGCCPRVLTAVYSCVYGGLTLRGVGGGRVGSLTTK